MRRLKQLQADAERRVRLQLAEDRRLLEEKFRQREYELRQQEEALYHDEQQALYEEEKQRLYAERLYADEAQRAYRRYGRAQQAERKRREELQRQIEADRQRFNEHYPDREFDEELAEEDAASEIPIIISYGKSRQKLSFVPGMTELEFLEYIGDAFPQVNLNLVAGLRPVSSADIIPLSEICAQPLFLVEYPRLVLSLAQDNQRMEASYEENTEEEQEATEDSELLFDEAEFFLTQEESDAVEALIAARDPAVQLAYEAYPSLSKLVNAFVRIIRTLAEPPQEEEQVAQPQDDALDNLLTKTIHWMAKQNLIDERQEQDLCELAVSRNPVLLDQIRQTASLEELIQSLRSIANRYEEDEGEEEEDGSKPPFDASVIHAVFEKLTNEEVSADVTAGAMDLITRNDPEAMNAIYEYARHRDWDQLLQTLEDLIARRRQGEAPSSEMHQDLRNQILAMRARVLAHRNLLEEKRAAHLARQEGGALDEEGQNLELELSRISKQLEELDLLLQTQLSQLDHATHGLEETQQDADMARLKNLVAVLSMDPSIGVEEAQWVKKFIQEMNPEFLDAYFDFEKHQSYDQYKARLLDLIARSKEAEEDEADEESELEIEAKEFAHKVLETLHKGHLLKAEQHEQLAALLEQQDPGILSAFDQLQNNDDWPGLYRNLISCVVGDHGEDEGEAEGDEGEAEPGAEEDDAEEGGAEDGEEEEEEEAEEAEEAEAEAGSAANGAAKGNAEEDAEGDADEDEGR